MKIYKLLVASFALLGFGQVWAVPCGDTTAGVFTTSSAVAYTACQDASGNDPYPGALSAFGETWDALSKDDGVLEEQVDIDLVLTGLGGTSGSWSFTNLASYNTYVVVLKAGNAYSAYLLNSALFPAATGATWAGLWDVGATPALSHLSVYGRLADVQIPAPGILALLGIGLLGMIPLLRARRIG